MTLLTQYNLSALISLLVGIGCLHDSNAHVEPRDAMELYTDKENVNILVADNYQSKHRHFVDKWMTKASKKPVNGKEATRRALGDSTNLCGAASEVKPKEHISPLEIITRYMQEKYMEIKDLLFTEEPMSTRRQEDNPELNETVSKFFPRFRSRHSRIKKVEEPFVEPVPDENDSLELLDIEQGSNKAGFTGFGPPPTASDYQHCGFTPIRRRQYRGSHFRVVGGKTVKPEAWPWMAAIGYTKLGSSTLNFHCGGTLISASHVVTAAHCALIPNLTLKAVRLGVTQLTDRTSAVDMLVTNVVPHKQFNWGTANNDIALLFLHAPVTFTNFIRPICLPYGKMRVSDFSGMFPYIAGWGLTEDRKASVNLQEVRIPVVPTESCRELYKSLPSDRAIPITDRQMCCGFKEGGRDACQGDSGGPLMLPAGSHPRGEIFYLIGVVSLGEGCAQPDTPGVFTRITAYMDWLSDLMGGLPPMEYDSKRR